MLTLVTSLFFTSFSAFFIFSFMYCSIVLCAHSVFACAYI